MAIIPISAVLITASVARAETTSLRQLFPALMGVHLTPQQQSELQNLSDQTLPKVRKLLTPEQQAQFNKFLAEGKGVRSAVLSLNLSIKQQGQISNLLQPLKSKVSTILTPAQQQQVQRNMQTMQKRDL
jgi:Spy/CpxP family protein refolding chaperone